MLQRRGDSPGQHIALDFYSEVLLDGFVPSIRHLVEGAARQWLEEPAWQNALCTYTSALCGLVVLYHELGHFASGHTSHYYRPGGFAARRPRSEALCHFEDEDVRQERADLTRMLAELTADTYAFVRLYLYAEPYDVLTELSVRTPYTFNGLVAPVQACLVPLYLTHLRAVPRAFNSVLVPRVQ